MANIVLSIFTLLLAMKGSASVKVLESTPPSVNDVLTACASQQISLTCMHDIAIARRTTFWIASGSVSCESQVTHLTGSGSPCGPFTLEEITRVPRNAQLPSVLNSTAVATATVDMTDTNIECQGGDIDSPVSIGNISLCIVAPPPPPAGITCINSTNGLNVTWLPVVDTSCAMSDVTYNVTATAENDMTTVIGSVSVTETTAELTNSLGLQPATSYNIFVSSVTTTGGCVGNQTTVTCETAPDLPTVTPPSTAPPPTVPTTMSTSVASSQSTSTPQPPSTTTPSSSTGLAPGAIAAIVVVAIVLVFLVIVIVIVVVIILMMSSKGKKNGRGGVHAPLATDPEHDSLSGQQQAPVYAMVDKSKKTAHAEQPTYQDPATIQHETAESGDLYAVSEKKGKAAKPGPEVAELYSEVDKSNKNEEGLTYASIEVDAKNAKKKPGGQPQEPQEPVLYSDIQLPH